MPGTAQTSKFLLSTATLMLGPMEDLHALNPTAHSIGLVKNVQINTDPQMIELTQGIRNHPVMSIRNSDGLRVSAEVYEFTAKNLAYGAGLDGADAAYTVSQTLYSLVTEVEATDDEIVIATDLTSTFPAGSFLFLQKGTSDYVHMVKVGSVAYSSPNTTITVAAGYEIPAGLTFPVGSRIGKVAKMDFGGQTAQECYAAKIIGLLPEDSVPFTILLPKVKITKGLSLAFQSDNFTNLPFELTPYDLVATDDLYAEFGPAIMRLYPR